MTRVLTSRRWQMAFWGTHVVGGAWFVACTWPVEWWSLAAFVCAYLTGVGAAVLVEIGTQ